MARPRGKSAAEPAASATPADEPARDYAPLLKRPWLLALAATLLIVWLGFLLAMALR
jgi:hypothetical protein